MQIWLEHAFKLLHLHGWQPNWLHTGSEWQHQAETAEGRAEGQSSGPALASLQNL